MISNEELRALAQAATPGEWLTTKYSPVIIVMKDARHTIVADTSVPFTDKQSVADAAYIAAANPARILALLDEIDRLRSEQVEHRVY